MKQAFDSQESTSLQAFRSVPISYQSCMCKRDNFNVYWT